MKFGMVATGGTIASRRDETGALVPVVRGAALIESIPLAAALDLEIVDLEPIASFASTLDDMLAVIARIRTLLDDGCHGVVVTHGTDTLEEMAFLTAMLLPADARVALTGAQRPIGEADSDAMRNLADAFVAVGAGLPVCVVMGGVAIAGAEARKVHSSALEAFSGGAAGAMALIDGEELVRLSRPNRGALYADVTAPRLARVDIVALGAGTTGEHLLTSAAAGAKGIVLEAMGRGNAGDSIAAAVREVSAAGVTVLVTSRAGAGLVRPLYGVGGGADLQRAGALFAGDLTTSRARVALALALGQPERGSAAEQIASVWKGRS